VTVYYETRSDKGYERWRTRVNGRHRSVSVHQLVAIADGADPHKVFSDGAFHIHHRDGVEWHNAPSNLTVVDAGDHARRHGGD